MDGRSHTFEGHTEAVACVAISDDGRLAASGSLDGTVRLWDVASGEARATLTGHRGRVTAVALNADGAVLVSGGEDRTVRQWVTATGQPGRVLAGPSLAVTAVAISADGQWCAAASLDRSVRVWHLARGRFKALVRLEAPIVAAAGVRDSLRPLGLVRQIGARRPARCRLAPAALRRGASGLGLGRPAPRRRLPPAPRGGPAVAHPRRPRHRGEAGPRSALRAGARALAGGLDPLGRRHVPASAQGPRIRVGARRPRGTPRSRGGRRHRRGRHARAVRRPHRAGAGVGPCRARASSPRTRHTSRPSPPSPSRPTGAWVCPRAGIAPCASGRSAKGPRRACCRATPTTSTESPCLRTAGRC